MEKGNYLMESDEEALRLDLKTDVKAVERQAIWAGIRPGMRVADAGCGPGKTTYILHKLTQPGGMTVGLDISEERISYAHEHYKTEGIEFRCHDIRDPLDDLGMFDFIWIRFVLEYYRSDSFDIIKNISKILKPGGILCLIDLDYNCLNHFGLSLRLERTVSGIMKQLEEKANFDPYVGRKLYSYLYDLGFQDIGVDVTAHHIIFGELKDSDAFNWLKKVEVAPKKIGFQFEEYEGGYEEFQKEFEESFRNPRRFTYTPLILCRGRKPL